METVTLQLQKGNLSRIKKFEKFSFLIGGAMLLLSAYDRYTSGTMSSVYFAFLYYSGYITGGLANIAAGVFYQNIPENRKDSIGKWLQVIIGILLLFDAIDKFLKGKIALPSALVFASILYFLVAFLTPRLKGRRFLTLDDNALLFRKSLFKIKRLPLTEIEDISYSPDKIVITLNNKKIISLFPGKNDGAILSSFVSKLDEMRNNFSKKIGK